MRTQAEKAVVLQSLHERDSVFIVPYPHDIGSLGCSGI